MSCAWRGVARLAQNTFVRSPLVLGFLAASLLVDLALPCWSARPSLPCTWHTSSRSPLALFPSDVDSVFVAVFLYHASTGPPTSAPDRTSEGEERRRVEARRGGQYNGQVFDHGGRGRDQDIEHGGRYRDPALEQDHGGPDTSLRPAASIPWPKQRTVLGQTIGC